MFLAVISSKCHQRKLTDIANNEYSINVINFIYYSNCEIKEVSDEAKNDNLAKWLWKVSEKWTKLDMQLRVQ